MKNILFFLFVLLSLVSCASSNKKIDGEVKNYQLKIYNNFQYDNIIDSCISTMQDLGFVVLTFDSTKGKLEGYTSIYPSRIIVSIYERKNYISVVLQAKTIEEEYKKSEDINDENVYKNFFKLLDSNLEN